MFRYVGCSNLYNVYIRIMVIGLFTFMLELCSSQSALSQSGFILCLFSKIYSIFFYIFIYYIIIVILYYIDQEFIIYPHIQCTFLTNFLSLLYNFPFPCISSSWNYPMQYPPFFHVILPLSSCFLLFRNLPLYTVYYVSRVPSSISPSLKVPMNFHPFFLFSTPSPEYLFSSKFPLYSSS